MTSTHDERLDAARLIVRARDGDRVARERVAERALRVALRTALALLGDRDAAAEVAQDVALTATTRLGALRDTVAFDAWVHRTAVRDSVRARRRLRGRAGRESAIDDLASDQEPVAAGGGDVHLRLAMAERLAALPRRQRAALVLRYVHDLADEDIAAVLRCRVGTVHALLSRGRAALRDDPAVRLLTPEYLGDAR